MKLTHVLRTIVAAATAVCGLGLTSMPSVQAAETGHEKVSGQILIPTPDEGPDATFCGLRDVPLSFTVRSSFQDGHRGTSPFPYFAQQEGATWTWTNPETGLSFTQHNSAQFRDHSITDNGDGTITLVSYATGITRVYGPDGELLFSDNGLSVFTILIGTNGTIDPEDDEFLGLVGEPVYRGKHETADRDFCEDFLFYTSA